MIELDGSIDIPNKPRNIKGKYVVIAIQSTAQMKYWNNPIGWERVFDYLKRIGYKIVLIDKNKRFGNYGVFNEAPNIKGIIDKTGNIELSDRIVDIKNADMLITLSSGLAWVAWALNTPTIMISGFTKPWNEFKTNIKRIHNNSVCNGCWNDTTINFDPLNWVHCPRNKNFECSKAIQPVEVINAIKEIELENIVKNNKNL
jgi:autotransporter strand-loop-strand O-heptosyltransferase